MSPSAWSLIRVVTNTPQFSHEPCFVPKRSVALLNFSLARSLAAALYASFVDLGLRCLLAGELAFLHQVGHGVLLGQVVQGQVEHDEFRSTVTQVSGNALVDGNSFHALEHPGQMNTDPVLIEVGPVVVMPREVLDELMPVLRDVLDPVAHFSLRLALASTHSALRWPIDFPLWHGALSS